MTSYFNKHTYLAIFIWAIFLSVLIFCIMLFKDDAPNAQSTDLNQRYQHHQQTASQSAINSYYYQIGMGLQDANASDDQIANPIEIGQSIAKQAYDIDQRPDLSQREKEQAVQQITSQYVRIRSNDKRLCRLSAEKPQKNCISISTSDAQQIDSIIVDGATLLHYYQHFLTLAPAVSITSMSPHAPLPNYQLLTQGQSIANAKQLRLAREGQADMAIDNLKQAFIKLRERFAQSDTMIRKLVLQNMLSEQLHMMSFIATQYDIKPRAVSFIDPLSPQEVSLELPYVNEYQMTEFTINSVDKNPISLWQSLLLHAFFKQQQTLNMYANAYQDLIDKDNMSASEFAKQDLVCDVSAFNVKELKFNNRLGEKLATVALINYASYKQRIWSTNNLIAITNYVLSQGESELGNIYAPSLSGVVKDDKKICMAAPLTCKSSQSNQDCMRLKFGHLVANN